MKVSGSGQLLCCFFVFHWITACSDVQYVGIVLHQDVTVFKEIETKLPVATLSLGSVVTWIHTNPENISRLGTEWIQLSFPSKGWIPASTVQKTSERPVSSWPLWRDVPQLFTAGRSVMGSKKLGLNWIDQWPVGTGGIGALVGGTVADEVIPISIADFYVVAKKNWLNFQKAQSEGIQSGGGRDGFEQSRLFLNQGNYDTADKRMGRIKQVPEGEFEYTADLIFAFVDRQANDFKAPPAKTSKNERFPMKKMKRMDASLGAASFNGTRVTDGMRGRDDRFFQPQKGRRKISDSGAQTQRQRMISTLRESLNFPFESNSYDYYSKSASKKVEVHELSFLDTANGIATTQHLIQKKTEEPGLLKTQRQKSSGFKSHDQGQQFSVTQIHHRKWFASITDNVLVGKLSCINTGDESSDLSHGCLNMGMQLSRQRGKRDFPTSGVEDRNSPLISTSINPSTTNPTPTPSSSNTTSINASSSSSGYVYRGFYLGPSEAVVTAHTYMCLAIRCSRSEIPMDITVKKTERSFVFTCSDGDVADVIVAVQKQDNLEVAYETVEQSGWSKSSSNPFKPFNTNNNAKYQTYSTAAQAVLSNACWGKIDRAVSMGHEKLELRHSRSFSAKMARVSLKVGQPTPTDTPSGGGHDVDGARHSTSEADSSTAAATAPNGVTLSEKNEMWRTVALFDYSRYLMLSAASKSVSNLQGLWTDGRKTCWNGDYHININLQMQYWASDIAGLTETLPPLFAYIKRITHTGATTALNTYGCKKGWVAHGFSDGYLDGGLAGGYHWSFCVTCGAWTALALWEHVTYTGDITVLTANLLPAFRGIAEFFLQYMFLDKNGVYQTGPTGSPENSYKVHGQNGPVAVQLSLSPAIDAAVLRLVANAYSIAVTMAKMARKKDSALTLKEGLKEGMKNVLDLEEEGRIAEEFRVMVSRMPYAANPVIGVKTGYILEYPAPFPGAITDAPPDAGHQESPPLTPARRSLQAIDARKKVDLPLLSTKKISVEVTEDGDPGHRHFSSMLWLYPGTFLPSDEKLSDVDALYKSAKLTLAWKKKNNGGHTSWSAAWEACLWARLGESEEMWRAMQKIPRTYVTPRLLSLHPPTMSITMNGGGNSRTAFTESKTSPDGKKFSQTNEVSGMVTADKSPFQLDGNMGYVAALCESLLQSHVPGHLILLPALPHTMAIQGGSVEGLRARGNAIVSISWLGMRKIKDTKEASSGDRVRGGNGCVHKATITFQSPHIWFSHPDSDSSGVGVGVGGSIVEDRAGFFSLRSNSKREHVEDSNNIAGARHPLAQLIIVYPAGKRQLRLMSSRMRSHGEGEKVDQKAEYSQLNRNSSRLGTDNLECARSVISQSFITSDDLTIAANPNKYMNSNGGADAGKTNTTGTVHPEFTKQSRRGLGIQIFEFPCKVVLKS